MKNLDLNALSVQEMNVEEMRKAEGGFLDFVYEVVTGRSLASDVRSALIAGSKAYAQVIQEGGTTSSQMPFP